jgi:amidohydrolase
VRVQYPAMKRILFLLLITVLTRVGFSQPPALSNEADRVYPGARALYLQLHEHPELSDHEFQTAEMMAAKLRDLGYQVTEHVGGTGVVALLKNGTGPTIMLRTELDALPVEEKTGLPYASKAHAKNDAGQDVPVMHACGHDLHMAAFYGTAAIMVHTRQTWNGTLMLIAQPAEETIAGSKEMLQDGLLTRFARPDVAVALHVVGVVPAGKVGVTPGVQDANSDSIRITIFGKGGHGAAPQTAIDPIVIAARTILSLQTIVSREVKPGEMAVLTVGYIHAGSKNNIIPDSAELGITVRTYSDSLRKHILEAIRRIANAEAEASGASRMPLIDRYEWADAIYNNPELAQRLKGALQSALGNDRVSIEEPRTWSEDFSFYVEQGIPGFYFELGGADPERIAQAKASGTALTSIHSSLFAPDLDPALHTGIAAEVAVLRNLFTASPGELKKLTSEAAH